jgi:hypothetical protein
VTASSATRRNLVRLRVFLDEPVGPDHQAATDREHGPFEVDVGPAETEHLAAAGAGESRQPHERRELGIVVLDAGLQPGELGRRRRVDVRHRNSGR